MAGTPPPLLIKRYASRRLYNTETSDYVTLEDIAAFIRDHRLAKGEKLAKAPFWSEAQANFLAESLKRDSDWAIQVDELAVSLTRDEDVAPH